MLLDVLLDMLLYVLMLDDGWSHCCTALQCITVCIGPSMHACRQQLVLFQEELKIDYLPKMMNKHLIMLIIIFLITLQY